MKKMLYELEYELLNLRHQYLNEVRYNDLTLKEVLDLGFNNVIVDNGVELYKDSENKYVSSSTGEYITDENMLNSKVKFVDYNNSGDYMDIYVKF